jgi:hypothetical protein
MKININKVKVNPKSKQFELCVFGMPDAEVQEWISKNNLQSYTKENYTNIILLEHTDLSMLFYCGEYFKWMDGFSPNLNKKLHIGHFSNLVLAKAFKSLGVCDNTVSIYGDTLDGEVKKEDAIECLKKYQDEFNFHTDESFMASEMKYYGALLVDGVGDYIGTKVFEVGENKEVGIKSNGQTSYFYQDVALAETLDSPTLYLTGKEQCNHFNNLKQIFPNIEHIGLGLVKVSGKKMASRDGNVLFIDDFINLVKETFNGDMKLIYNVFAGFVLKSNPDVDKNINLDLISNPKNSAGLYLSYTMARLNSAGCDLKHNGKFNSLQLSFAEIKSKVNLKPNILFEALVEHCKNINALYLTHTIKDNEENKLMFNGLLSDLLYGCNMLGLFTIDKV